MEVTFDMIDELEQIDGNQYVVLQRRIHRIFFRMTLDGSEVQDFLPNDLGWLGGKEFVLQ